MNSFNDWQTAISNSFGNLWEKFINYLPSVLGAIIVLIVGLLLASALSQLARRLVEMLRIDSWLKNWGVSKQLDNVGFQFNLAEVVGWVVKWFIIIAVWIAVLNVLHLERVGDLLEGLLFYLPNVVTAVIILAVGIVGGSIISQVVEKAVAASQLPNNSAGMLAGLSRWALVIFALLAALTQLGVATRLIEILFAGLVIMVALAGGLAFGLGGRGRAEQWLEQLGPVNRPNQPRQ